MRYEQPCTRGYFYQWAGDKIDLTNLRTFAIIGYGPAPDIIRRTDICCLQTFYLINTHMIQEVHILIEVSVYILEVSKNSYLTDVVCKYPIL